MNLRHNLVNAGVGWLAGVGIVLIVGFVIFPAIITNVTHFAGTAVDWALLGIVFIPASIAALAGGMVGGRLAIEGGRGGQLLLAAIVGAVFASPISCLSFWYSGW